MITNRHRAPRRSSGRSRSWSSIGVLIVTAALIGAACGSRSDDDNASKSTTTAAGSSTSAAAKTDSPCGPGDAKGATDKGVTDTGIRIAIIADIKVAGIGNLFQGNLNAMKGFVAYCNSLGGINGRKLTLDFIDSKLLEFPNAMRQACDGDYLALVGSAAALDGGDGPAIGEACGIVDVPGFAADDTHRNATNMVAPLPNPVTQVQIGAQLMMKAKYPDAVKKAVYVYSNRAVTLNTAVQRTEAMTKNGWTFGAPYVTADLPTVQDYQAIVTDMKSKGVEWVSFVGAPAAEANLRKAMDVVGWHPTVSDADASAYDQDIVEAAGAAADGLNFNTAIVPLDEAADHPETQLFLDWTAKEDASTPPTALGVQSFSAGLLFANVVKSLGSNVTRKALLAGLKATNKWTGYGLHTQTDPGANTTPECMAWMTIDNQKFVRVQPKVSSKDIWACSPDYVADVKPPNS